MLEVERRLGIRLSEDLVYSYVNKNQPLSTIAARYGVAVSTVSRWLAWLDVPIRRQGRPPAAGLTPIEWNT